MLFFLMLTEKKNMSYKLRLRKKYYKYEGFRLYDLNNLKDTYTIKFIK